MKKIEKALMQVTEIFENKKIEELAEGFNDLTL